MVNKTGRKKTGGKYIKSRKKKLYERAGQKRIVKLSDGEKRRKTRIRGGNTKIFLLRAGTINLKIDSKTTKKIKIKNVLETPSNRFLARQNILTKGTIVQTELGKARITNRPTQEGVVNGILVKE